MKLLINCETKQDGVSHGAAQLYRFDQIDLIGRYETSLKSRSLCWTGLLIFFFDILCNFFTWIFC